jgi:hypothetical protein
VTDELARLSPEEHPKTFKLVGNAIVAKEQIDACRATVSRSEEPG